MAVSVTDQTALNDGISSLTSSVNDVGKELDFGLTTISLIGDGDVYRNYRWGVTSKSQPYLDEIPIVILTEFQPNSSEYLQEIAYSLRVLGGVKDSLDKDVKTNPYLKMYSGVATGNVFQLPFFSTYNHQVNSSWTEPSEKGAMAKGRDILSKYGGGMFQRGSIEKRKVWAGSNSSAYAFTFTLYNTQDQNDIVQNIKFIRTLTNNALPSRTSYATILPPCIYTLEIPGVRYAPAVSLDGVNIENLGQVNRKKVTLPNSMGETVTMDMNIPDAYEVTISVSELLTESRELYSDTFNAGSRISIINAEDADDGNNINISNLGGGSILGR